MYTACSLKLTHLYKCKLYHKSRTLHSALFRLACGVCVQLESSSIIAVLSKSGEGRHVYMCAWAESIENVWLPCTNILCENFRGPSLIQTHESNRQVKSLDPFCVPISNKNTSLSTPNCNSPMN